MIRVRRFFNFLLLVGFFLGALTARAEPVEFQLPVQPLNQALIAFSRQANLEVLFSYDELKDAQSEPVEGRLEPEDALNRLLQHTGFIARRGGQRKFIVTRETQGTGTVRGRLVLADGAPAQAARIQIPDIRRAAKTDEKGEFTLSALRPGRYRLVALALGYYPLEIVDVRAEADRVVTLQTQTLQLATDPTRLDPVVVEGRQDRGEPFVRGDALFPPRTAAGNIDLLRTENDALPFTVYDRDQIARSGVVNLNEFLSRELLDSDASGSLEQATGGSDSDLFGGSTNLKLRGYQQDETVVLVNGLRLPEALINLSSTPGRLNSPDASLIPLSLVEQVQVLPASASALYSGNPVGGVINIILRPDVDADATEVTATYTNALQGYDAPQSSLSLLHGQNFLHGALRVRMNANFTRSIPATESELGFHRANDRDPGGLDASIYRATPNIRGADLAPLFGPNSSPVTSVAPGSDGLGGLSAFTGRAGVRNLDFFNAHALAASPNSLNFAYGRKQRRATYFGSAVYDARPWLQIGLDGTYALTVLNRGYDVVTGDLQLRGDSPLNPFRQDVWVSLNEVPRNLGAGYSEGRSEFASGVLGLIFKLPADWQISLDTQLSRNVAEYRGLLGANRSRWQQLVDQGGYNPLRDTQVYAPPPAFYDQVLIYRDGPGKFVKLGDYQTIDAALRVTNSSLTLPTGQGVANFGGDFRRNQLAAYAETPRFADGTIAGDSVSYAGRTLTHYSVFTELQAPVVPSKWLPGWLHKAEADLAVRYVAADSAKETNVAPTAGLKLNFAGGFSLRGSVTTSNRFPTPAMSRKIVAATGGSGSGLNLETISDPSRGGKQYEVEVDEAINPSLRSEAAVTQTAGVIYQTGKVHRIRLSLDFLDTRKTNELIGLGAQDVINLESLFPERVVRAPLAPGDPSAAGKIANVYTGTANFAWRHSQNWNAVADYAWSNCWGGTLEFYGRAVYFQRYDRQVLPTSRSVDELDHPDSNPPALLKYRANFGLGWDNRDYAFGLDAHYFHSRVLPVTEQIAQGSDHIDPFWQFDAFVQKDLSRWLPWKEKRHGLRGQLRVNNLFNRDFPRYANESSGAGVQPYTDWRGRTYSVSLTATF